MPQEGTFTTYEALGDSITRSRPLPKEYHPPVSMRTAKRHRSVHQATCSTAGALQSVFGRLGIRHRSVASTGSSSAEHSTTIEYRFPDWLLSYLPVIVLFTIKTIAQPGMCLCLQTVVYVRSSHPVWGALRYGNLAFLLRELSFYGLPAHIVDHEGRTLLHVSIRCFGVMKTVTDSRV
jgi:hypothetical protein